MMNKKELNAEEMEQVNGGYIEYDVIIDDEGNVIYSPDNSSKYNNQSRYSRD